MSQLLGCCRSHLRLLQKQCMIMTPADCPIVEACRRYGVIIKITLNVDNVVNVSQIFLVWCFHMMYLAPRSLVSSHCCFIEYTGCMEHHVFPARTINLDFHIFLHKHQVWPGMTRCRKVWEGNMHKLCHIRSVFMLTWSHSICLANKSHESHLSHESHEKNKFQSKNSVSNHNKI